MIVANRLAPGQRIDEKELCQVFGISRTPLREALKVLASEGLVELNPNRSPHVAPLIPEEIGDLMEVIAWLEQRAGELAAAHAGDGDVARLRAMHEGMVGLHKDGNRFEYFQHNRLLHLAIIGLAGNSVLTATYTTLMVRIQRARYLAIHSQRHWDRGVRQHEAIIEAIAAGDSRRAGALLLAHVRETGQRIRAAVNEPPTA